METVQPEVPSASLYVGDLESDVTEEKLLETFIRVGPVASIRVCRDKLTHRSLGYAYVNFHSVVDAERALDTLNNQLINGKPCRIMWSHRDPSIRKSGVGNIFIKNLDPNIGHKELFDTFSVFGNILSCKVALDQNGHSKGFGFVHFETADAADNAIKIVHEKMLGSKIVYVGKFISKKERIKEKDSTWTNVYIKDLDQDLGEEDLARHFRLYGPITSVVIMRHETDLSSKGFGFINFQNHHHACRAVEALRGRTIGSKKIWCGRAQKKTERKMERKKYFNHQQHVVSSGYQGGVNLYIKNLEDEIGENRLKMEFSNFGKILSVKIMVDEKGDSKGFGFICFSTPEEAQHALSKMNNRILRGCSKPLYVAIHEPKQIRRAKLAQRNVTRKAPPGGSSIPIPITQGRGGHRSRVKGHRNQPPGPTPVAEFRKKIEINPGHEEATLQHLLECPPEKRKNIFGELLYPFIEKWNPLLAGKITGMLLDCDWPVEDFFSLLHDEEKLHAKVNEAVSVLEKVVEQEGVESPRQVIDLTNH